MECQMRCPVDNETLVMADRSGVEIDYCPKCRGVWLDRGELDKIIDRAAGAEAPAPRAPAPQPPAPPQAPGYAQPPVYQQPPAEMRDRRHRDDDDDDYRYKKKRRESFLGDIFDF
jgi:uncharacterized protein